MIEVDSLTKRYGDVVAADGITFTVEPGEIFGILGPNGAGKTTTVECIAGLRRPDAGRIRVLNLDPVRDRTRLRRTVGVQLQNSVLPDALKVGEAMTLYRSFYSEGADPARLLADLNLTNLRNSPYSALSGGEAQRLSIALALIGKPRIAILDELTTGLDPQARRDTWELITQIRDTGVTILLVSHFMEEAQRLCDRVAIIDRGRLAALDTPDGLIARVDAPQRVHLKTRTPVDPALFENNQQIEGIRTNHTETVITGTGNLLHTVTVTLLEHNIAATETRHETATLEDAFLALTGRRFE
ncbi:ABC transporter ATP-binding protein [Actinomadura algeriensis]|uniref:ABC-2 type transport system ATP-binding protein n=1 Tax=Actinomadura algeriensis TaxID=1679523 RepID=A0ABR9JR18_9ACTN|nr:ABC transporter ATP-binding protein [Actinomadura algeriensis]MBE1532967.1 ABC-2 type transport system ATP-binding protein [Actinomadura algeriensis]